MFLISTKGCNIKKFFLYRAMDVIDMCGVSRKASAFLDLFFVLSLLVSTMTNSVACAEETKHSTIVMLGDSLTQGYGLMPADNFVSKLEAFVIKDKYPFKLINLGVSGDTTAGGLARFDWSMTPEVSGAVIILGGNDLLRGISPKHSYDNLRGMILMAETKKIPVLLVGMMASNNFGMKYKEAFDSVFEQLNAEFNLFYYENFFSALHPTDITKFLSYMQSDGIHPNAEGVKQIVNDFYPTFVSFLNHIILNN